MVTEKGKIRKRMFSTKMGKQGDQAIYRKAKVKKLIEKDAFNTTYQRTIN